MLFSTFDKLDFLLLPPTIIFYLPYDATLKALRKQKRALYPAEARTLIIFSEDGWVKSFRTRENLEEFFKRELKVYNEIIVT